MNVFLNKNVKNAKERVDGAEDDALFERRGCRSVA